MPTSFVKSAPELAEEILAKTAMLPKDLKSFRRELLEKKASTDTEKLELPKRLSIADLQKIASEKKVDLPNPGPVKADDYASVAGDLRKIAKANEDETARDVLATAVAIVAHSKEAGKKLKVLRGAVAETGGAISSVIPGTAAWHQRMGLRETAQASRGAARTKIPGTPEFKAKIEAEGLKATKAETAAKLRGEAEGRATTREFAKALPGAAIGTGLAVSAPGLAKKEPKSTRYTKVF